MSLLRRETEDETSVGSGTTAARSEPTVNRPDIDARAAPQLDPQLPYPTAQAWLTQLEAERAVRDKALGRLHALLQAGRRLGDPHRRCQRGQSEATDSSANRHDAVANWRTVKERSGCQSRSRARPERRDPQPSITTRQACGAGGVMAIALPRRRWGQLVDRARWMQSPEAGAGSLTGINMIWLEIWRRVHVRKDDASDLACRSHRLRESGSTRSPGRRGCHANLGRGEWGPRASIAPQDSWLTCSSPSA